MHKKKNIFFIYQMRFHGFWFIEDEKLFLKTVG